MVKLLKVDLLKIEKFHNNQYGQALEFLPGGIQISEGSLALHNKETVKIKMDGRKFLNVTEDIKFNKYFGDAYEPFAEEEHSLINLLAVEGFVNLIYKKMEETQ